MESPAVTPAPDCEIPNKIYFRIGEVARLASLKPYVLRFWESEFSTLGPAKSGTGQRLYRRKDVETVLEIKRLLYEKRFTIEGARKMLANKPKLTAKKSQPNQQGELFPRPALFVDLRRELGEILTLLNHPAPLDPSSDT